MAEAKRAEGILNRKQGAATFDVFQQRPAEGRVDDETEYESCPVDKRRNLRGLRIQEEPRSRIFGPVFENTGLIAISSNLPQSARQHIQRLQDCYRCIRVVRKNYGIGLPEFFCS